MTYEELIVLIPSHGFEDIPTDLGDQDAAGLLNSFAVPWHPVLIHAAKATPRWHRADVPPEKLSNRLIMVPGACADWLPHGWVESARNAGAVVVESSPDRESMLEAALSPLTERGDVDSDLAADFLALGHCQFQIELMARQMHYFGDVDDVRLQRDAMAAAAATLSGDSQTARARLQSCFECLTEARERFHPVDCYLIDVCLVNPRTADQHLERVIRQASPVNLLASAEDLEAISRTAPEMIEAIRKAWHAGSVDCVGGEFRERPTLLMPVESLLWQFERGHAVFHKLFGRTPKTWGRRRFGLCTLLPQVLTRFRYNAAMHVVLDDGIYPDAEYSKVRWEGCDRSVVDAVTRIPLAADAATSFLRFPGRMSESMEQDQVAVVLFARWPEVQTPWFEDFQRIHAYAPALGRFITFENYFKDTEYTGHHCAFSANEYLTPFLVQAVAREEPAPVTRYIPHLHRRRRFDAAIWYGEVARLLTGRSDGGEAPSELEPAVEAAGPEVPADANDAADRLTDSLIHDNSIRLADAVMGAAGGKSGYLVLNPLSFSRRVTIAVPELDVPPAIGGPVKFVQFDNERRLVTVDVPGSGFAWFNSSETPQQPHRMHTHGLIEQTLLSNELFEVHINEQTGGIGRIKGFGRSPNRLSQQLAFRFRRARVVDPEDVGDASKSFYSEMRATSVETTCNGPSLGEIVSRGDIVDQVAGTRLAGFRQTVRLWRGRPVVELDIELEIEHMPEGDPWSSYFACRFAWNDSTAALTRSLLMGAQPLSGDRFESPDYLEIADENQRTTILSLGLPFHRKTAPRMVDTLLVTSGEQARRFRFVIVVDEPYPMQAALDAAVPVAVVPTKNGPPVGGQSGWFFHVDAKNVQLTRLRSSPPAEPGTDTDNPPDGTDAPTGERCVVQLIETEGRSKTVKLRCFQTPVRARLRSGSQGPFSDLSIIDDYVSVHIAGYQIVDIELEFQRRG